MIDDNSSKQVQQIVDEVYRSELRRVFATLVRLIGDFDLAEEALHDAFAAAVEKWPLEGVPANPRTWLVSTGRFKAIDVIRRRKRFDASLPDVAGRLDQLSQRDTSNEDGSIEDDRLRLIFTCCHPALSPSTQIALTLREVCELTTEEIGSAFLTAPVTIAQRIVRGKAKIRDAKIPYVVPSITDLPDRLDSVLSVIYLVFNEGYSASSGASLTRCDLSEEAIRIGRLLVELLPDAERLDFSPSCSSRSLGALRASPSGDLILLEDQDRSLWNRQQISDAKIFVERAISSESFGVYTIQAAIASVHAEAPTASVTQWPRIVALYDLLLRAAPSPVVELNRAVAVAMRDGPVAGLELIDAILARGELADYHLAHAARADLCRRLGQAAAARESYHRALSLARQDPERRFLEKRIHELD